MLPPVTTTPQDILEAAYGTSIENVPGAIASESTELLKLLIRAMRGIYAVAARVNPTFFADSAAVAYAGNGWARPNGAESVFRIEKSDGTEVVVVPYDDKRAEPSKPAVYSFGQIYRSAGNANDPLSTDALTFYFSKRPEDPANLDAPLDALWVEQFNSLLILIVALYLAEKDGRKDEVPGFMRDIEKESTRFVQFLEHETVGMRRRWGHIKRFNTQTTVPIMSILTGRATSAAA